MRVVDAVPQAFDITPLDNHEICEPLPSSESFIAHQTRISFRDTNSLVRVEPTNDFAALGSTISMACWMSRPTRPQTLRKSMFQWDGKSTRWQENAVTVWTFRWLTWVPKIVRHSKIRRLAKSSGQFSA